MGIFGAHAPHPVSVAVQIDGRNPPPGPPETATAAAFDQYWDPSPHIFATNSFTYPGENNFSEKKNGKKKTEKNFFWFLGKTSYTIPKNRISKKRSNETAKGSCPYIVLKYSGKHVMIADMTLHAKIIPTRQCRSSNLPMLHAICSHPKNLGCAPTNLQF